MNNYMNRIGRADLFVTINSFWSSSEYSSNYACYVSFYMSGSLIMNYDPKYGISSMVRCVFAF